MKELNEIIEKLKTDLSIKIAEFEFKRYAMKLTKRFLLKIRCGKQAEEVYQNLVSEVYQKDIEIQKTKTVLNLLVLLKELVDLTQSSKSVEIFMWQNESKMSESLRELLYGKNEE